MKCQCGYHVNDPTLTHCKLCGADQEFRNSLTTAGWERETLSERLVRTSPTVTRDGEAAEPEKDPLV